MLMTFRLSDLINSISATKIPDHAKNLVLEITAEDTTETDVEVPYVMLKLNR